MEKKVKTTEQIVNEFINDAFENFKTEVIDDYEYELEFLELSEEDQEEEKKSYTSFGEFPWRIISHNTTSIGFINFMSNVDDPQEFFERQKRNEILYNNRYEILEKLTTLVRSFKTDFLDFSEIDMRIEQVIYLEHVIYGYKFRIELINVKEENNN